jgi:hypothetical protein
MASDVECCGPTLHAHIAEKAYFQKFFTASEVECCGHILHAHISDKAYFQKSFTASDVECCGPTLRAHIAETASFDKCTHQTAHTAACQRCTHQTAPVQQTQQLLCRAHWSNTQQASLRHALQTHLISRIHILSIGQQLPSPIFVFQQAS